MPYTCYPVCSQSEDQLLKLMDVFLSCMEEPDALKKTIFFRREALRYELENEEDDLSLEGTVFNEDWGHLTDIQGKCRQLHGRKHFMKVRLLPICLAAPIFIIKIFLLNGSRNVSGEFYRYSNCLIVLYGKMDIRRVLDFMDRNHLSRFPQETDAADDNNLLSYFREPVRQGIFQKEAESPAYEGNPGNNSAVIDYAIDLSDCGEEDLIFWDLVTDILDQDTSAIHPLCPPEGY